MLIMKEAYLRYTRRRSSANREKLDKVTEKLIKVIRFEVEVEKSLACSKTELHKKRLRELQRYLD